MASWREVRQEALQRDNHRCQVFGKEHSGQVHHFIPRSQGGTNDLSNLITLCGRCHMLVSPVPQWLITKFGKFHWKKLTLLVKQCKIKLMRL